MRAQPSLPCAKPKGATALTLTFATGEFGSSDLMPFGLLG
jgi:hypothetical protein